MKRPISHNPEIIINPRGLNSYKELKIVKNICPRCTSKETYYLRFQYDDEGKKVCQDCRFIEKQLTDEEWNEKYGSQ